MSEKLKPCPYCGSKDVMSFKDFGESTFNIYCSFCGMTILFATELRMIEFWNSRPIEVRLSAELMKYKVALVKIATADADQSAAYMRALALEALTEEPA